MKKIILLFLLIVVNCTSSKITPYENMGITANNLHFKNIKKVKSGESCAKINRNLMLDGTASIIRAQSIAGIKTIKMVDYKIVKLFNKPREACIVVYGE